MPSENFGQKSGSEIYVKSLFENSAELKWIKHFKGRIDDINDVSVTIGFDGVHCRGQLTYLRSREKFNLDGKVEGKHIWLNEVDASQKTSGVLTGEISGKRIVGTWLNHDQSKGGNLLLEEIKSEVRFPSYCGDNKWIRKYQGVIFGENVEIILQKESNNQLSGLAFFKRKNKTFTIKGNTNNFEEMTLRLKDEQGFPQGAFTGILEGDRIEATFENPQKNVQKIALEPVAGLTIGCIEYADYMTSYDITFPKTINAKFNEWMDDETSQWISACRTHSKKVRTESEKATPEKRSSARGFAWCEVDFFSEKIISGFMTYGNTWTPGRKLVAYNFDLENNSKIYLEDIFVKNLDYEKFIKNYVRKEIRDHKMKDDPEFKKWLKRIAFPHFTIRKNGLCFSSDFNMIFGRQSVTIPYQQLKPFLKKNTLVWGLAE